MLNKPPDRPMCRECGLLAARPNGTSVKGFQRWHTLCNRCANQKYKRVPKKAGVCSGCGFVCQDTCQMCLVDGRTVCLNCNALRLKGIRPHSELTVDATVDWSQVRI